jgi:ABC-2 type transport system ATP-binding protein
MNAIETYDLSKSYGDHIAIDQVNLLIPAGSIYGIVGPQRSGKTTLLRLLATLTMPTGGDALVAGSLVTGNPLRVRRNIGYMPHQCGVYPDMTVEEYLRFFAGSYGIVRDDQNLLVQDLLQLVDLNHKRSQLVTDLTPSMRQRLSLARTLAHDPQILLMDEPISGLDPRTHVEMRELMKELRTLGKTILVTAPLVADLAGMCTHIAIIEHGRIVVAGGFDAIHDRLHHLRTITVKFFGNVQTANKVARSIQGTVSVEVVTPDMYPVDGSTTGDTSEPVITVLKVLRIGFNGDFSHASEMLRQLTRSGVQVVAFSEQEDTAQSLLVQCVDDTQQNLRELM